MKNSIGLTILLVLIGSLCSAQVKKKIKRGRRNKSESQFSLPANYIQLEWEGGIEKINSQLSTIVHPNWTVRYGISKKVEVNLESSWVTAKQHLTGSRISLTGWEPLQPGMTVYFSEEKDNVPAISLSVQLGIPFLAGKYFTADHLAPTIQLSMQKNVTQKFQLALSGGAYWDGFIKYPSFVYYFSPAYELLPKVNAALEFFGYINGSAPQHNGDFNIMYSLHKKLQVGITAGTGLSVAAHKSYFAINVVNGFATFSKKISSHSQYL